MHDNTSLGFLKLWDCKTLITHLAIKVYGYSIQGQQLISLANSKDIISEGDQWSCISFVLTANQQGYFFFKCNFYSLQQYQVLQIQVTHSSIYLQFTVASLRLEQLYDCPSANYCQTSGISGTKSQHFLCFSSHLAVVCAQSIEARLLQLHLSNQQVYCLLKVRLKLEVSWYINLQVNTYTQQSVDCMCIHWEVLSWTGLCYFCVFFFFFFFFLGGGGGGGY